MTASEAQGLAAFMDPDEQIEQLHTKIAEVRQIAQGQVRAAYSDLAQVLAVLAAIYPSVIARNDPAWPTYQVLYVQTLAGQLTWPIAPEDVPLFARVPIVYVDDPRAQWDGHTTEQKNARMAQLRSLLGDRTDAP